MLNMSFWYLRSRTRGVSSLCLARLFSSRPLKKERGREDFWVSNLLIDTSFSPLPLFCMAKGERKKERNALHKAAHYYGPPVPKRTPLKDLRWHLNVSVTSETEKESFVFDVSLPLSQIAMPSLCPLLTNFRRFVVSSLGVMLTRVDNVDSVIRMCASISLHKYKSSWNDFTFSQKYYVHLHVYFKIFLGWSRLKSELINLRRQPTFRESKNILPSFPFKENLNFSLKQLFI